MSKIIVNRGNDYYEFNLDDTGTLDNDNKLLVEGVLTVHDKELGEDASHWQFAGRVLRWDESTGDFHPVCLTSVPEISTLLEEHIWREFGFSVALYCLATNNWTRSLYRGKLLSTNNQ